MGVILEVFDAFHNSLKGKRVISYSDAFKEYMLEYIELIELGKKRYNKLLNVELDIDPR